jgi:hypothetical protein
LPLELGGVYNFEVNWGDGNSTIINNWNDPNINHTYSSSGNYTINITGTIKGWRFNNARDSTAYPIDLQIERTDVVLISFLPLG